jgi:hypothetical protein
MTQNAVDISKHLNSTVVLVFIILTHTVHKSQALITPSAREKKRKKKKKKKKQKKGGVERDAIYSHSKIKEGKESETKKASQPPTKVSPIPQLITTKRRVDPDRPRKSNKMNPKSNATKPM